MPITGIAELTYGVDDIDKCIRFFEDFGLSRRESSSDHAIFEVVSGQRLNLFRQGDSRIPKSALVGPGVHECVWALDNQADLDGLVKDLSRAATKTLMCNGAFFSRPYGENARMVMNKDAANVLALNKIKKILDPNNILNPGKLCF